ncbi:hypothetical protein D1AOALGA4SA_6005 [Olavius algarvensis Delta 1 endosymbiont]|nr:hypothetical protein D1AOALGA4SA_6005 [Olavius algarvensis Delta 1 endosymbiont]
MEIKKFKRKFSITRSNEFARKKLATHALNVGLLCGHGCLYCSTPAMMRTQKKVFKDIKGTSFKAFQAGIAVVDPTTPQRIAPAARRLQPSDTVMFCTYTDGWSPEAQKFDLGRRCLRQILTTAGCRVRILTKNAAVKGDFDVMQQFADRVELSLSLTAPPSKDRIMRVLEPNASSVEDRIEALQTAKRRKIPLFGILCPCLPGIADTSADFGELLDVMLSLEPTAIWTEPVNPRGPGLKNCAEQLKRHGFCHEAGQINAVRKRETYQKYVDRFIKTATSAARHRNCLDLLKILVYENGRNFKGDDQAVVWLK